MRPLLLVEEFEYLVLGRLTSRGGHKAFDEAENLGLLTIPTEGRAGRGEIGITDCEEWNKVVGEPSQELILLFEGERDPIEGTGGPSELEQSAEWRREDRHRPRESQSLAGGSSHQGVGTAVKST